MNPHYKATIVLQGDECSAAAKKAAQDFVDLLQANTKYEVESYYNSSADDLQAAVAYKPATRMAILYFQGNGATTIDGKLELCCGGTDTVLLDKLCRSLGGNGQTVLIFLDFLNTPWGTGSFFDVAVCDRGKHASNMFVALAKEGQGSMAMALHEVLYGPEYELKDLSQTIGDVRKTVSLTCINRVYNPFTKVWWPKN